MIIFDLETTGLPKAEGSDLDMQPRIIEFGGIKVDDDFNKIDSLEFLCNPGHLLDPKIIKITKITDDMTFRSLCIHVLEHFETIVLDSTFNKGRSYYASIIYIAANINLRHDITCQKISEITGFSRWVIWRQTKAILNMIGYNNAKELKGKDINKIGE